MTTGSFSAAHLTGLTTALAGRYRLERELGAGGMATVWLAEDLRHGRRVAIKVLHPELSAVLGPERFLAEIRTTANLQHPHILPLFDSGSADGLLYYVMPYVEGETLRARLERERQLPVADALRITGEIADALDYAHRHGVIHRDIKPENILLHDAHVVVADFGIALAVQQAGGARMTQTGLSLGTPQYMSPEQATGDRAIDGRTDVYSLGAVTYEMLAGEPPHVGSTAQAVIARLMTEAPRPLTTVRHTVPEHVDAVVRCALEKLPADRFATAREFAEALTTPARVERAVVSEGGPRVARPAARMRALTPWGVALAGVVAGLLGWRHAAGDDASAPPVVQFRAELPAEVQVNLGTAGNRLALAPDGSLLAIIGRGGGSASSLIYLRPLGRTEFTAVRGSEGASQPTFSPDGRWIAYEHFASLQLRRIPAAGGVSERVAALPSGVHGIAWRTDGNIIFATSSGELYQVRATGGQPVRLRNRAGMQLRWPQPLPDPQTLLVTAGPVGGPSAAAVYSLRDGTLSTLAEDAAVAWFVRPDHLVTLARDGNVTSEPVDLRRRRVRSAARRVVVTGTARPRTSYAVAVAQTGTLALFGDVLRARELVLIERGAGPAVVTGRAAALPGGVRAYRAPRFSPDGRRVAVGVEVGADDSSDVWIHDVERGTLSRATYAGSAVMPAWMPDGRSIIYSARVQGSSRAIFRGAADGSGAPELLVKDSVDLWEGVPSPDGQRLVYRRLSPTTTRDIWTAFLDGRGVPSALLATPAQERSPVISPDGRWLAYVSDESGRDEVYVRSLAGDAGRTQVSVAGGLEPQWARSGREVLYRNGDSLYTVPVRTDGPLRLGAPSVVLVGSFVADAVHANWDVHPDGRRLVLVQQAAVEQRHPTVLLHWFDQPGVRERVAR